MHVTCQGEVEYTAPKSIGLHKTAAVLSQALQHENKGRFVMLTTRKKLFKKCLKDSLHCHIT